MLEQLDWHEETFPPLKSVENMFRTVLLPALASVVRGVWKEEVPSSHLDSVEKYLREGLKKGLLELRKSADLPWGCWYAMNCLPRYWEPPATSVALDHLPAHQVQAYRWTVSLLAFSVRNSLEYLHWRFQTQDARMPLLNRGIRNTLYALLLQHPAILWRISLFPRILVAMHVAGLDVKIPKAVG